MSATETGGMTELLAESRLREILPDGYESTIYDSNRLRQLENADLSNLEDVVDDYGQYQLTERQVIESEVQRVLTSFVTPERTLEFPGTGLEYYNDHIVQFASRYKANQDTPSGTIKDARRAGPDDIVFTFASPEVYDEISGTAQDTFFADGLSSPGELELIGDNGLPDGGNSSDASLQLDDDEMLFFTGDFIDLSGGQSVLTAGNWADIDGEDYGRDDFIYSNRLAGTHVATMQGGWVKQTADLDMKIYQDGDAEVVPVAFYMAPGGKAPSLT